MRRQTILLISSIILLTACATTHSSSKESFKSEASENSIIDSKTTDASSKSNGIESSNSSSAEQSSTSQSTTQTTSSSKAQSSSTSQPTTEIQDDNNYPITVTTTVANGYTQTSNLITITKAGTYSLSGQMTNGMVMIDAPETAEISLELNGVKISCNYNSPIFGKTADKIKIKAQKGTKNEINDTRPLKTAENDLDETLGNGAIYAKCDLNISGKGYLKVTSTYNNGIHSTKDLSLRMKNDTSSSTSSSLDVTAVNNAVKGNDSVEILSGINTLISSSGDGIKTDDTDVSSKGNQRGNVTITGGETTIYSYGDGIDASYNVEIKDGIDEDTGAKTTPTLNIYTSNYSSYSDETIKPSAASMYIRSTTRNSSTTRYSVLFKDSSGNTEWSDATFDKSQQSGRTTYYYYKLSKPSTASSLMIYKFNSSSENSTSNYLAVSRDWSSVNANYDTMTFTESGTQITNGSWSAYSAGGGQFGPGGGMQEGNSNKADYSAKGIKSDNEITVNSGSIKIKAYDDGMHANYGTVLENGSTGTGDLTINGGSLEVYASDDGLHADRNLNINGGSVNITNAYEGIEGNLININGGTTKVYATDDGINAANKANISPLITVTGGMLDITVNGNDVDGIDSNGSYKQTGGIVVSRGYGTNRMSTGLDVDGTATLSGGTMALFGQPEKAPSLSNGAVSKTISGTYGAGTWVFTCGSTSFETVNQFSHSGVYIYSTLGSDWNVVKK